MEQIIALEWKMFDRVHNPGGRAACQNDPKRFASMRASQFAAWSPELRDCYWQDLQQAAAQGRNVMQEKYAYMMARTCPAEYAAIQAYLPPLAPEKQPMIDRLCEIHVQSMERLAARYPRVIGRGRPIRRQADSPQVTSSETYLWGELQTYSQKMLDLLTAYAAQLARAGQNLDEIILQNTVVYYGYASLEDAENALRGI